MGGSGKRMGGSGKRMGGSGKRVEGRQGPARRAEAATMRTVVRRRSVARLAERWGAGAGRGGGGKAGGRGGRGRVGGWGGGRRGSGRAANMGGGRARAVGTLGLCPKSCKRFGVKSARGENMNHGWLLPYFSH